ncbi:4-hydroxybenzoate octaprenyltransferase [Marinibaculum pumilum]|uniref:4-hydroxybenzoate octaprenyltransferase n=1 Tax=Marinibaculum pumilum TaxID=1766165 RepID=A0ABV7KVT4_9PROT
MTAHIADAARDNWIIRFSPDPWRPYLELSRLDRPIGTWLLLLPCWWSVALAMPGSPLELARLLLLFGIGAMAMRGAGCTFNDIVDRRFDGMVERTRNRPLPSGRASVRGAWIWLGVQALVGLAVLLQLTPMAVWLGIGSLGLVAIYPFMKRFTWWPQLFLGLAFNWGALMGWAAVTDGFAAAPAVLYLAGIFWTLGYDTIYAHQDKQDDALIGVKSSARRLGGATRPFLWAVYAMTIVLVALSGWLAGLAWPLYLALVLPAAHMAWQTVRVDIDDWQDCLNKFRANKLTGLLVLAAIALGHLAAAPLPL